MNTTTSPSTVLGFEETTTGYRATDAQVEWWQSRDTCPACGTVCEPISGNGKTEDYWYSHDCDGDGDAVEWSLSA